MSIHEETESLPMGNLTATWGWVAFQPRHAHLESWAVQKG